MTTEAKLTIDVTGEPKVRALVDLVVRIRNHWLCELENKEDFAACAEEIDEVVRQISGQPAHIPEAVQPTAWPQIRLVRHDSFGEISIGAARWAFDLEQWERAACFIVQVRRLWDMRAVWADEATPVDGPCAKGLLEENERLRKVVDAGKALLLDAQNVDMLFAGVRSRHVRGLRDAIDATESNSETGGTK